MDSRPYRGIDQQQERSLRETLISRPAKITGIAVATIQGQLPAPVVFGDWIMKVREFAVVRLTTDSGHTGWAFTLTRDGAVAEQIRKSIAPVYIGSLVDERSKTFRVAKGRSFASHSAGVGLRALSLIDLAAWDAAAKIADKSIAEFLGGRAGAMPATAIIGYPPASMNAAAVGAQVAGLWDKGWRRFKAPMGVSLDESAARLQAARDAAPTGWLGSDLAWMFSSVADAVAYARRIEHLNLGWIEDIFPPGNAGMLAELRKAQPIPLAQGDEQGGSYYPEALIQAGSVDVVRIDLTCMGGITGGRAIVDECLKADQRFAAHMFAHVHSQVFSAWGFSDCPVEWGVPWTGVDPYADSLVQPDLDGDGRMRALPAAPGFGDLVNREWALGQPHDDPDHILAE